MRVLRIARGVGAELVATGRVLALTRWPFWAGAAALAPVAVAGVLLDEYLPAAPPVTISVQAAALVVFFAIGLFSGRVARRVRRRRRVRYPDGPEVHPYLPQLVIVLAAGPFFVAMAGLFFLAGRHFPAELAVADWPAAWLLVAEQVLRGGLFFDAAEIYHVELTDRPAGFAARTLLFVTRLMMDLVFVKLVIQVGRAALHRAADLGRGDDVLLSIHRELGEADDARVTALARACGDSLRDAVDDLVRQPGATDPDSPVWHGMVAVHEFAVPYLRSQARWQAGTARRATEAALRNLETTRDEVTAAIDDCLRAADVRKPPGWAVLECQAAVALPFVTDRLTSADPADRDALRRLARALRRADPVNSWGRAFGRAGAGLALAAGLAAGAAAPFLLDGLAACLLSAAMVLLLGYLVVRARGWVERLVRWGVLRPVPPKRLPWVVAAWTFSLFPLLSADAARLFQTANGQSPGVFGDAPPEDVDLRATAMYVAENLLRTQLFLDAFEIYGVRVARLEARGPLGCSLTMLVRLTFDLGLIELLVSFATVWFNRAFRGIAVTPNAELELRAAARDCGPLSPALVRHYAREVRDFFVGRMREHERRPELFVALVAGGFLAEYRRRHPAGLGAGDDDLAFRLRVGALLRDRAYLRPESLIELEQAAAELDRPGRRRGPRHAELHAQARVELAFTLWYLNRFDEAERRAAEAVGGFQALLDLGADELAVACAWARYVRAIPLYNLRRYDEAVGEQRAALAAYRRALAGERRPPARLELQRKLALALGDMGTSLSSLARFDEAVAAHEESIRILSSSDWDAAPWAREDRATYQGNLGYTLVDLGRPAEAEAAYRRAVRECRELERDGLLHHPRVTAATLGMLGSLLHKSARSGAAAAAYREAIADYERALRRGCLDLRADAALAYSGLGQVLRDTNEPAAAEAMLARALDGLTRVVREDGRADLNPRVAETHFQLALLHSARGRTADAVAGFAAAAAAYETCARDDLRCNLAEVYVFWGDALLNAGDPRGARPHLERAVPVLREAVGRREFASFLTTYLRGRAAQGAVHVAAAEWDAAVGCLDEALAGFEARLAGGDAAVRPLRSWCRWRLAEAHLGRKDWARAEAEYRTSHDEFVGMAAAGRSFELLLGAARSRFGEGASRANAGRPADAIPLYLDAERTFQEIQDRQLGEVRGLLGGLRHRLGEAFALANDRPAAEGHFRAAVGLFEPLIAPGSAAFHGDLMRSLYRLGEIRYQAADKAEAGTHFRRAASIVEPLADAGDVTAVPSAVTLWRSQLLCVVSLLHADAQRVIARMCDRLPRWHAQFPDMPEPTRAAVCQLLKEVEPLAGPLAAEVRRVAALVACTAGNNFRDSV
ncbi:MAG: tetratricopeptide repeat protein [Gemmataceae bacterium]